MNFQVLFDGTVATSEAVGYSTGLIVTESGIAADAIAVTFNGTKYKCPNISTEGGYEYGAPFNSGSYDFSVFPFNIYATDGTSLTMSTENPGEYTVKIEAEAVVKTIMHSPLTRDPRFELVFESDDMPQMANGWEVLSGNNAEEYMQDLSTDSRFKYFFLNSSATVPEDPVISEDEPVTPA